MPAVELHLADADALAIQRVSAARAWSPGLRMAWYQRAWPGTQACVARYSSNHIHIKYIHSTDNSGPLALHQAGIYILYMCINCIVIHPTEWEMENAAKTSKALLAEGPRTSQFSLSYRASSSLSA